MSAALPAWELAWEEVREAVVEKWGGEGPFLIEGRRHQLGEGGWLDVPLFPQLVHVVFEDQQLVPVRQESSENKSQKVAHPCRASSNERG